MQGNLARFYERTREREPVFGAARLANRGFRPGESLIRQAEYPKNSGSRGVSGYPVSGQEMQSR